MKFVFLFPTSALPPQRLPAKSADLVRSIRDRERKSFQQQNFTAIFLPVSHRPEAFRAGSRHGKLGRTPPFQSSGELPVISPERANDIDLKHERVAQFLKENRLAALLLQRPANLAWFTSGADFTRHGSSETTASLFLLPEARVVLTSNVESALFESALAGHGFQLKERPWHEPHSVLVNDVCRGRQVGSDTGVGRTTDVSAKLLDLRLPLNSLECERLRELGLHVAHAVEATARHFEHGITEAEIAAQLAHRLLKHKVFPEPHSGLCRRHLESLSALDSQQRTGRTLLLADRGRTS